MCINGYRVDRVDGVMVVLMDIWGLYAQFRVHAILGVTKAETVSACGGINKLCNTKTYD